jgi:hypothetical protein
MNLKQKKKDQNKKRIKKFRQRCEKNKNQTMCLFTPNLAKQKCVFTLEIRAHNHTWLEAIDRLWINPEHNRVKNQ